MTRSCGSILLAMCVLGAISSCDEPAVPIEPTAVAVGELGPVFKDLALMKDPLE